LYVRVELLPEEVAAVEAANVGSYIIVEYGFEMFGDYVPTNYDIKMVLHHNQKGTESRFVAPDAVKRNELEREIKEGLAGLARIMESSSPKESESFEFDTGRGSPAPPPPSGGRFCTNCGFAVPPQGARFCTNCGQQIQ
jgi:hypothetical protein